MALESRPISCGLKVHFTSRLDVYLFVQYARGRFPVILLAQVARLAHTQKSLGPHSGEMRPPEIAPQLDLPLPRRGSTTQPRVDTYAWRTLGQLPPRVVVFTLKGLYTARLWNPYRVRLTKTNQPRVRREYPRPWAIL
jgi:hypothetical protein